MFAFIKSLFKHNVVGRLEGCSQELHVDMVVLKHVSKYRQTTSRSTEAGGQLFGAFDNEKICVVEATGPYIGDYRSRSSYRSNLVAAQRAIEERSLRGLLYLGEWHTHAEDHPVASGLDDNAMHRLIENSTLNSNSLLMLIAGRASSVDGLAIWSVTNSGAHQWKLQTLKARSTE